MSARSAASAIDAHAASSAHIPSPSRMFSNGGLCCIGASLPSVGLASPPPRDDTPPPARAGWGDALPVRGRNGCSYFYAGRTWCLTV